MEKISMPKRNITLKYYIEHKKSLTGIPYFGEARIMRIFPLRNNEKPTQRRVALYVDTAIVTRNLLLTDLIELHNER